MANIKVPNYLEDSFSGAFSFSNNIGEKYEFCLCEIGLLNIQDGKIIACDPFLYNDDAPFNAVFPIGHFPIQLAIAKINDDERVGFARIKFSEMNPVNWRIAVCDGQNLETLEPGDIYGYGVDAGTGSFADSLGAKYLSDFRIAEENNYMVLIDEMQKTYKNTRSWLLWEKEGSNVALFSSGWGDGYYATYIGYDGDNNICRLVTDFGLLDWP